MAHVRDVAITEFTTAVAGGTANMPDHESGDAIIVFTNKDTASAMTQTGTNYTAINSQTSAGAWGGTWYRLATTSAEPAFVATWSSETACIVVVSVANAHTSNAPTGVVNAADDSTIPYAASASKTTPSDNCLTLYGCSTDAVQGSTGWPTDIQCLYSGDAGANGVGVGWMFYPTSGTQTSGVQFYANSADDVRIFTVCVEDNGNNSVVPAYVDQTSTAPVPLTTLGAAALTFNARAWSLPASLTHTMYGRDFTQVWNFDGTTYTDETTDMNDTGTGDVALTNTTSGILYLGYSAPFYQMCIDVGTAGTGSPTQVWEYYNGSTWATLSGFAGTTATDVSFATTGNRVFRWTPPSDWSSTSVNSVSAYYIRRRQTANWTIAAILDQGAVNGMGALYDAVASTADSGVNPYHTSTALSGPATVPDIINQVGNEALSGTAIDMDPGYLLTTFKYVAPRDLIDCGLYKTHKGVSFGLIDTSNNYKQWTVAAKDGADTIPDGRIVIGIQPTQSVDTAWAAQGSFDAALVDTVITTASSAVAAVAAQFSDLWFVNGVAIMSGGNSTDPKKFVDLTTALVNGSGLFPTVVVNGSAGTFYVPIQMGGGDPSHYAINLASFQFPTQSSEVNKTGTWHVDENIVGIEFNGQSGDTMHFTGCTFISDTPFYWRFNASASASADWDFTGSTVANATVTLQDVTTFNGITFNGCDEIVLNEADLTLCTFQNQRIGDGFGAVVFTSASEGNGLTTCTFANNNDGDLGHSIRITAAGTYNFDGHTFSGGGPSERSFNTTTGVDAGTDIVTLDATHGYTDGDAIYYQRQGGAQNIGLTDGSLYYVNAQSTTSLSFHSTKAAAVADTGKIALTSAGGETHYIYSAKADVYNNSAGIVTINILSGGDTPTIRNSNGSSTNVVTTVDVNVHVENNAGSNVSDAQVFIRKSSAYYNYTSHNTNNSAGDTTFEVNETIDTDLPQDGWLHIWDSSTNTKQEYRYTSRNGKIFSLPTEVTGTASSTGDSITLNSTGIGALNIQEGDAIRNTTDGSWASVDELSTNSAITTPLAGGSDNNWQSADSFSVHKLAISYESTDLVDIPLFNGQTDVNGDISTTYGGATPVSIVVRIRSNEGVTKYVPFNTNGSITSNGFSLTAILTEDTVAT